MQLSKHQASAIQQRPDGRKELQLDILDINTASGNFDPAGPEADQSVIRMVESQRFEITPVAKPRQTQSDRWKQRPCVVRYRAFKDQVKASGLNVPETGCRLIFILPMPKSWPKKRRAEMDGQPHQQRPDTDNMIKAVLDAVHTEDSQIHHVEGLKFWGETGAIIIQKTRQAIGFDGEQILWQA